MQGPERDLQGFLESLGNKAASRGEDRTLTDSQQGNEDLRPIALRNSIKYYE